MKKRFISFAVLLLLAGASSVLAQSVSITMGETSVLSLDDNGNGNMVSLQKAVLAQSGTLQSLSLYVPTAAGKVRLGVYDASGPGGNPGIKLGETAEITPTTGWNTAPVTAQSVLAPGTYWLAYFPSSDNLHYRKAGNSGSYVSYPLAYGALPQTLSSATTNSEGVDHWSFYATLLGSGAVTPTPSPAPTPTPAPTPAPAPAPSPAPSPAPAPSPSPTPSPAPSPSAPDLVSDMQSLGRYIDWSQSGVPGGIPNRTTICSTIPVGATRSTIQAALDSCAAGGVVKLSAGTYNLSGPLTIPSNVTLRGSGPRQTVLSASGSGSGFIQFGGGATPVISNSKSITSGYATGSRSLTLSSASGIAVGSYLLVSQLNDPAYVTITTSNGSCTWCDGGIGWNGTRVQGQIVEVTGVSGNVVTVAPGLYVNYARTPLATPFSMGAKYAGVEDLQVYMNNSGYTANFMMNGAAYSWIKNVESNYTDGDHAQLHWGYRNEIRDSYFHDAFTHSPGSTDSDLFIANKTSGTLIENNMLRRLHVSIMLNWGAAGNVIAYNFMDGNFDTGGYNTLFEGLGVHGAHPMFNLWEGNIAPALNSDYYWGSASHNAAFRNWFKGTNLIVPPLTGRAAEQPANAYWATQALRAVDLSQTARYTVLAGNVIGSDRQKTLGWTAQAIAPSTRSFYTTNNSFGYTFGYANLSDTGTDAGDGALAYVTTLIHGDHDYVTGIDRWDASISSRSLPASLYLFAKPSWFGTRAWPAEGPDVSGYATDIPAKYCYEQGSMPNCLLSVGSPSPSPAPSPSPSPVPAPAPAPAPSGSTITATSCALAVVQSAVDSASDGATIIVPAGTCTWNAAVSVANKTISLQGAGSGTGGTKIVYGGTNHTLVSIDVGNKTGKVSVSGFWFQGGDPNYWNGTAMEFHGPAGWKNLRIHHNLFDGNTQWTMKGDSHINGLIDHNTFQGSANGIMLYGDGASDWAKPLTLGTSDFFFIEDNTFQFDDNYGNTKHPVMDMDDGGRQVFRHNTVTNGLWETHDKARSGLVSAQAFEIYSNTISATTNQWKSFDISAGTGVVWGNTIVGDVSFPIGLIDYKSFDPRSVKLCDGTDPLDQNVAGQTGWRCQYQIGTLGEGASATSFPLYIWSNTYKGLLQGVACTNGCNHLLSGRDYIDNGSTAKPGYVSYTYPHPLQGGAVSPPAPAPAPTPTPVNGSCGSANGVSVSSIPTSNLCSTGTASSILGAGPWSWSCTGANGGSTQSCSAPLLVVAPPSTKFAVNDRVQVASGPLNIRATANTTGVLLGTQVTNALGTIIGGPVAQGGYNWWQVNFDTGVDGYGVEDYLVKYVAATSSPAPSPTPPAPAPAPTPAPSSGGGGGSAPSPAPTPVPSSSGGGSSSGSSASGGGAYIPPTPASPPPPALTPITKPLAPGSTDPEVTALQRFLITTNLLPAANQSGVYDSATESAVRTYQCQTGITCSGSPSQNGYGTVGPTTRTRINATIAIIQGGGGTVAPTSTTSVKTSSTKLTLTRNLYRGLKSPDVTRLQDFLISLGYLASGSNSGYYGPLTQKAVQSYQCAKMQLCSGTPASNGYGSVGPKTRGVMGKP